MIQLINSATIDAGSITVEIAPYDTGNQTVDVQAVTAGTYNVAAGQYKVKIFNAGVEDITVNGDTVPPAETVTFNAFSNPATQKLDLTPALEIIVPAGGAATYSVTSPSA